MGLNIHRSLPPESLQNEGTRRPTSRGGAGRRAAGKSKGKGKPQPWRPRRVSTVQPASGPCHLTSLARHCLLGSLGGAVVGQRLPREHDKGGRQPGRPPAIWGTVEKTFIAFLLFPFPASPAPTLASPPIRSPAPPPAYAVAPAHRPPIPAVLPWGGSFPSPRSSHQ